MNVNEFQFGCDPEIFVKKHGKLVTAHGLIPGDKHNPFPVPSGAIQVDGMALEFNTDPCSLSDFETFNKRVISVMRTLRDKLPDGHTFCIDPCVEFDQKYYASVPEEAKMLGCDPDFNAWEGGRENPGPDVNTSMRTASGHIHIGWGKDIPADNPEHIEICCDFVRELDIYVGLLTLLYDPDNRRRSMYGRAGAFRPKSYGVEYRVPSNMWLRHKAYRKAVFDAVMKCVSNMSRAIKFHGIFDSGEIQRIINEGDREAAINFYAANIGIYGLPAELFRDFDRVRETGRWVLKSEAEKVNKIVNPAA